jgi:anti-sigma factor RsiW
MSGVLDDLESNQALLLMYLADELTAQDRTLVERKLAADASLRTELATMEVAHSAYLSAMRKLDEHQALPVPESVAADRASRIIRQWATERLARPKRTAVRPRLGLPGWVYPVAAAAAAAVVFISLDTILRPGPMGAPPVSTQDPIAQLTDQQQQELIEVASNETPTSSESSATPNLDEADNAVAGLQGADNMDNVVTSVLSSDNRQETQ